MNLTTAYGIESTIETKNILMVDLTSVWQQHP